MRSTLIVVALLMAATAVSLVAADQTSGELDAVLADAEAASSAALEAAGAEAAADTQTESEAETETESTTDTESEAETETGADSAAASTTAVSFGGNDLPNVHNAIAWMAGQLLGSRAREEVKRLIGDISLFGGWADDIKKDPTYAWSYELHFVNVLNCEYDPARDCRNSLGQNGYCADGAIQNFTMRLANPYSDNAAKVEALKFLLHLIGDIHNPLHVSNKADAGGNFLKGSFLQNPATHLHAIWDSHMLKQRCDMEFNGNFTEYRHTLLKRIEHGRWAQEAAHEWRRCARDSEYGHCSEQWARESAAIACKYAYAAPDGESRIGTGFTLGMSYYERNIPVVERQVAKAAVRLANVLTQIWPDVDVVRPNFVRWTNHLDGGVTWIEGGRKQSRRLTRPSSWSMGSGWPYLSN